MVVITLWVTRLDLVEILTDVKMASSVTALVLLLYYARE